MTLSWPKKLLRPRFARATSTARGSPRRDLSRDELRRRSGEVRVARLRPRRREATLTVEWIAARRKMGTRQSTTTRRQEFKRRRQAGRGK